MTAPPDPCLLLPGKMAPVELCTTRITTSGCHASALHRRFDPKIVLRGGYGVTDYLEGGGVNLRPTLNPPFFPQFVNAPATPSKTTAGNPLSIKNGFSNGSQAAITQYNAWAKNLRPTAVQQFNLTDAEYLINNQTTVTVGYVGEIGQRLIVPASPNQWTTANVGSTAPFFNLVGSGGFIILTVSEGVENYNSLQATLQHHQSGGLEYTLNYAWARSMTNNPGFFGISGVDAASAYWQTLRSEVEHEPLRLRRAPKPEWDRPSGNCRRPWTGLWQDLESRCG